MFKIRISTDLATAVTTRLLGRRIWLRCFFFLYLVSKRARHAAPRVGFKVFGDRTRNEVQSSNMNDYSNDIDTCEDRSLRRQRRPESLLLENPIEDRLSTPLFLPPHPPRLEILPTVARTRITADIEAHRVSSHPPTRSLVDCPPHQHIRVPAITGKAASRCSLHPLCTWDST